MGFARTLDWSYFAFLGSTGLLQAEKGNVLVRVGFVLMAGVHMDRSHISVLLYVLRRTMGGTMVYVFVLVILALLSVVHGHFYELHPVFLARRVSHGFYYCYFNGSIQYSVPRNDISLTSL